MNTQNFQGNIQSDYRGYPDNIFAQKGWICPKCGRVYAPFMPSCTYCGNEVYRTNKDSTGVAPNYDQYKITCSNDPTSESES